MAEKTCMKFRNLMFEFATTSRFYQEMRLKTKNPGVFILDSYIFKEF